MKRLIIAVSAMLSGCTFSVVKCDPKGAYTMEIKKLGVVSKPEKAAIQAVYDKGARP